MGGPKPKDPAVRQRRNKKSTAAALSKKGTCQSHRPERGWRKETLNWWTDVWDSPMAAQYLQADVHALYRLAELVDRFWQAPSVRLASEIRHEEAGFGLTPLDRARLQWKVAEEEPKPTVEYQEDAVDPRTALRAVK